MNINILFTYIRWCKSNNSIATVKGLKQFKSKFVRGGLHG